MGRGDGTDRVPLAGAARDDRAARTRVLHIRAALLGGVLRPGQGRPCRTRHAAAAGVELDGLQDQASLSRRGEIRRPASSKSSTIPRQERRSRTRATAAGSRPATQFGWLILAKTRLRSDSARIELAAPA